MLKRSLFRISLVGVGNIANAVLGFVFLTAVAKILSVEDFGKYALLISLLVSVSKIIDFGTNSLFVAESIVGGTADKDSFLTAKVLLFLISVFITLPILYLLNLLAWESAILFIGGLVGYGVSYTLFPFFQKYEKFHLVVALNTVPAVVKGVFGVVILLNLLTISLTSAFGIFALAMLFSSLLGLFLPEKLTKFAFSPDKALTSLVKAAPAGASLLINESWQAISNTVITISKTLTDVGVFSLANKIANIFMLISLSIFTVLLPKNALRKKENLGYDVKETLVLSALVILVSFAGIFASKLFIQTVFGEKFSGSLNLLAILIMAGAVTAIHTFMENYFYIERQIKILFLISTSKLAAFLTLAAALVPSYSLRGLAYAHLLSALLALAATSFVVVTHSKTKNRKYNSIQ